MLHQTYWFRLCRLRIKGLDPDAATAAVLIGEMA
jgi:hypothetical protein